MYVSSVFRGLGFVVKNCLFLAPLSFRVRPHDLLDSGPAEGGPQKVIVWVSTGCDSLRSIELVAIVHQSTFLWGKVKI
jgi:hypothetical protein